MIPRNMPELHKAESRTEYRRGYDNGVRIHQPGARGRPVDPTSLMSTRPWEDEGISRSTWLRRKKASGE